MIFAEKQPDNMLRYKKCHKNGCMYLHDGSHYKTKLSPEDWQRYLNFCDPVTVWTSSEEEPLVVPIFWMVFIPKLYTFLEKSEITFPHSSEVFFALQNFVGTGNCDIHEKNVAPILKAARDYQVPGLKLLAGNFLFSILKSENVLQILGMAEEYLCNHFRAKIIAHILKNFPDLCLREDFLSTLHKNLFLEITKSSFLNIKESQLLSVAIRWAFISSDHLRAFSEILKNIRFSVMTHEQKREITLPNGNFYKAFLTEKQIASKEFQEVLSAVTMSCSASVSTIHPENRHFRVPNEFILSMGGFFLGPLPRVESYDPRTRKWIHLPRMEMRQSHAYHGQVVLGGHIYIFGGYAKNVYHKTTHKLNLSTGLWSRVANLLLPRCYVSAAVLQGKIYAMGGFDGSSRTKTVERFDPEGNKWEAVQSMEIIRSDACAFSFGNKLMVVGGFTGSSVNSSTEIFDGLTGEWKDGPSLSVPRSGCKVVVLGTRAYVIGGYDGQNRLSSVESIDLCTLSGWEMKASLNIQRSNFGATNLDGKIVVAGGFDGRGVISSVETYCPKANVWRLEKENIGQEMSALSLVTLEDIENPLRFLLRPKSWRNIEN